MSFKDKLFTLINTRFYTKEELDSKATVVFMGYSNEFTFDYNEKRFSSSNIAIGHDSQNENQVISHILVMELPFGAYDFEANSEHSADIVQNEYGSFEVNQKLMFADAYRLIGEPQVTTQQEIE